MRPSRRPWAPAAHVGLGSGGPVSAPPRAHCPDLPLRVEGEGQPVGALGPMLGTDASRSTRCPRPMAGGPRGQGRWHSLVRQGGPGSQPPVFADALSASLPATRTHTCAGGRTASRRRGPRCAWPARAQGPLGGRTGLRPRRPCAGGGQGRGSVARGLGHSCGPREGTRVVKTDVTGQLPLLSCTKWGPEQAPREQGSDMPPFSSTVWAGV